MTKEKADYKKATEKLWKELVDCMNVETEHSYKTGNGKCFEEKHILEALLSAHQNGVNEGPKLPLRCPNCGYMDTVQTIEILQGMVHRLEGELASLKKVRREK